MTIVSRIGKEDSGIANCASTASSGMGYFGRAERWPVSFLRRALDGRGVGAGRLPVAPPRSDRGPRGQRAADAGALSQTRTPERGVGWLVGSVSGSQWRVGRNWSKSFFKK